MLQRTRASQVEPVWAAFVERFPSAAAARLASEAELSAILRPLGLDWRLRNLRKAVRVVADTPSVLSDPRAAMTLEGVGHYAASAVACFANSRRVAVVDVNVVRIYCRLLGIPPTDYLRRSTHFHALAQSLVPLDAPREYNWALLDLAATVCRPGVPSCAQCPLASHCQYGQAGRHDGDSDFEGYAKASS